MVAGLCSAEGVPFFSLRALSKARALSMARAITSSRSGLKRLFLAFSSFADCLARRFASLRRVASAAAACYSGVRLQTFLDALSEGVAGSTFFGVRFFERVFVSGISPTSRGLGRRVGGNVSLLASLASCSAPLMPVA